MPFQSHLLGKGGLCWESQNFQYLLTACTRTTICSRPTKDSIWMIRWPISFWNYNSYFTFRFSIFQYSNFHILFSHIQILCWRTDVRSNVEQLAVLKLLITKLTKANRANQVVTKITKQNPKYKSIPAAIPTAENHGRPAITENHEGDSFLLLWDLKNWIFVLEQKSGYSSQATSTSSLWRLPLEWSPVRFSNEDNSGSSRWEPTRSKSAQSISTVSNTFNGRRSAFLRADHSWSLIRCDRWPRRQNWE